MRSLYLSLALFIVCLPAIAQPDGPIREISFPDIPGFQTLTCDLHIHTVFSDGSVWPDIRVREALLDGLDAISLTEHLEYQPHAEDIPHPDRNRSYEIASELAADTDLLIIRGSEITRDMPPGHVNAVFIEDANALLLDDPAEVLREAKHQGAFVFWNHPNWTDQRPNGVAELTDFHRELMAEGVIHGIEVVNDLTYSDEALEIAYDQGLSILGTSDIHGLVDWRYEVAMGGHRSLSLVFAREKSLESIKEALFAGRTVAALGSLLVGREEFLKPLIEASIMVVSATYDVGDLLGVSIENSSSATFLLRNLSDLNFHNSGGTVMVKARGTTFLQVKTVERRELVELEVEVLNALTAPKTHPRVILRIPVEN